MNVWLKNDKSFTKDFDVIGKTNENKSAVIKFNLTEEMAITDFYVEYEKLNGEKASSKKLDIISELINEELVFYVDFPVSNNLLDIPGTLKLEVVLRKNDEVVWKSNTIYLIVLQAINASEEYGEKHPDFIEEAQAILDELEIQSKIFTDTGDGTKYLADDGTYKIIEKGEEINVNEFQTALENISGKIIGYDCKTINEVLKKINSFYEFAKIVVNAIDSVTKETLTEATVTVLKATDYQREDGYFYIPASDTQWTMRITEANHNMKSITFVVSEEDAKAGIKTFEIEMVAREV